MIFTWFSSVCGSFGPPQVLFLPLGWPTLQTGTSLGWMCEFYTLQNCHLAGLAAVAFVAVLCTREDSGQLQVIFATWLVQMSCDPRRSRVFG